MVEVYHDSIGANLGYKAFHSLVSILVIKLHRHSQAQIHILWENFKWYFFKGITVIFAIAIFGVNRDILLLADLHPIESRFQPWNDFAITLQKLNRTIIVGGFYQF